MTEAGWTSRQIVYRELERMASIYPLTVGANKGSEGVTRLLESLIAKMDDSYQQGRVAGLAKAAEIIKANTDVKKAIEIIRLHSLAQAAQGEKGVGDGQARDRS